MLFGFHRVYRESMGNIPKMFFFYVAWVRAIQEIASGCEVGRSHPNPHGFLVNLHPRNLVWYPKPATNFQQPTRSSNLYWVNQLQSPNVQHCCSTSSLWPVNNRIKNSPLWLHWRASALRHPVINPCRRLFCFTIKHRPNGFCDWGL